MDERTEEPSPRKLRKARERGEVPVSPLATFALVLAGTCVAVALGAKSTLVSWRALTMSLLSSPKPPGEALAMAAEVAARSLAWPLAAAVACGALGSFFQVGPLFAPKAIAPRLARLRPARLFSKDELVARLGALALAMVFFALGAQVLAAALPGLLGRTGGAPFVLGAGASVAEALFVRILPVLALAGVVAIVYRRVRFHRAQRMTRREVRQEQRELEGEPEGRRRRAARHRELARASVEALAGAAIVVRGAARAVVVRWSPSSDAPPAIAHVARGSTVEPLVARAALERVPVVHDEPLAGELERLRATAALPRAALLRLARHLARASRP